MVCFSMSNEMMFYGGIIIAGFSLFAVIIYMFISQINFIKLNSKLNLEYGEKNKRKKH